MKIDKKLVRAVKETLNFEQEELDEMVHDSKGDEAATINNDGKIAQTAYLLDLPMETVQLISKGTSIKDIPVDPLPSDVVVVHCSGGVVQWIATNADVRVVISEYDKGEEPDNTAYVDLVQRLPPEADWDADLLATVRAALEEKESN